MNLYISQLVFKNKIIKLFTNKIYTWNCKIYLFTNSNYNIVKQLLGLNRNFSKTNNLIDNKLIKFASHIIRENSQYNNEINKLVIKNFDNIVDRLQLDPNTNNDIMGQLKVLNLINFMVIEQEMKLLNKYFKMQNLIHQPNIQKKKLKMNLEILFIK